MSLDSKPELPKRNMLFEDKLIEIINVLENHGIILIPGDSSWSMACSSNSEFGYRKIRSIVNIQPEFYLCTDSIRMLKKFAPLLHPRIETLLCFYERPINIIESNFRNVPLHLIDKSTEEINISLSKDEFLRKVIELLGEPLVLVNASITDEMVTKSFSDLPSVLKDNADYICKHRRNETISTEMVSIKYDYNGMLVMDGEDSIAS